MPLGLVNRAYTDIKMVQTGLTYNIYFEQPALVLVSPKDWAQ